MKARFRQFSALMVCIYIVICPPALALDSQKIAAQGLTRAQAGEILALVMQHQGIPPSAAIEYLTKKDETDLAAGYFAFGVTGDDAKAGASTAYGMFAVNQQTGDVWEWNLCRRYRFAKLVQMQKMVMQKTGKRMVRAREVKAVLGCG